MQLLQELETNRLELGVTRQDPDLLTRIGRLIGMTAGYLSRAKAKDIIADAKKRVTDAPEGYVTGAAAMGFLLGILVVRDRR